MAASAKNGEKRAEILAATIRTLRAQIISNAPPVWRNDIDDVFHSPAPPLRIHYRLFAILAADSAQTTSTAAWADLHAMWILDRALFDRPEPSAIRTALLGRHMIFDASRRLGSRPGWWREFESFDARVPQTRASAYDVWLTAMQICKTIV